jgi:hypothetical protein
MKSIAAYYAFLALNSVEQDAQRRRAELTSPPRPSMLARARMLLASARPAQQSEPTTTPA